MILPELRPMRKKMERSLGNYPWTCSKRKEN
jgi:hypothetical protein